MDGERGTNKSVELKLPMTRDWQRMLVEKLAQYQERLNLTNHRKVPTEASMTAYSIIILQEVLKGCPININELQERVGKEQSSIFIKKNFEGAVKVVQNWLDNKE